MATWILTTGNSDVQLKTEAHWKNLYKSVQYQAPICDCDNFLGIGKYKDEETKRYIPPARVLGLVYGQSDANKHYQNDLVFPLLDTFLNKIQELDIDKVIILLTDQAQLFQEDIEKAYYPFWQDTCELDSILQWYFQEKSNLIPEFCYLKPTGQRGIDHWNEMLKLMSEELEKIDIDADKTVYVSHQAGTPAISSALQFVSLGKFSQVQFLMSNQLYVYDDDEEEVKQQSEAQIIPSSNYWRGIQIQKAKQLILAGLPGAALELLEDLNDINQEAKSNLQRLVDIFNIKANDNQSTEFKWQDTIDRVTKALYLIEIFFKNENYIQGIALLAATHEAFLKAAIMYKLEKQNSTVANINITDLVRWDNSGMFLKSKRTIENIPRFQRNRDQTTDLSQKLQFPLPEQRNNNDKDSDHYSFWNRYIFKGNSQFTLKTIYRNSNQEDKRNDFKLTNSRLYKWLTQLANFETWSLLEWSYQHKREYEDDRRNQLMHNLRGTEKQGVIKYLMGNSDDSEDIESNLTVDEVYTQYVKKPFIEALYQLQLRSDNSTDNQLQKDLKKLADSLQ